MANSGVRYLPEFSPADPNTCAPDWELYKRDFLIYLDAIGLDEKPGKRKVGVLLSSMGREAIRIYDSFVWAQAVPADDVNGIPETPGQDKHNLEEVFAKFDQHFGVHHYRNIKRQEFLNTRRGTMTIMNFIAELKRKAERCEYGDQKESLICDMVINGVNDSKCSEKLMEIPTKDLRLDKVVQVCRQVELTAAHLKSLNANNDDAKSKSVNQVKFDNKRQFRQRGRISYSRYSGHRQGYLGIHPYCDKCCKHHEFNNCPAYNQFCITCGTKGHFKKSPRCRYNQSYNRSRGRSRTRNTTRRGYRSVPPERRQVHYAQEFQSHGHEELNSTFEQCTMKDVFTTKTNKKANDKDWVAKLNIDNTDYILQVDIDSGARCNVLSRKSAEMFSHVSKIKPSDIIINGVSGKPIKAHGQITLPCSYKGTKQELVFQVIDNQGISILGREDCTNLGLIARVNRAQTSTSQILDDYSDVLGDEIGCIPGEYEIKIDPNVQPVVHPPRPVPAPLRNQLRKELNTLIEHNIIKPVTEPTRWVNSMVCVRKKNGRVRICIDPSDLNKAIQREHFPMNSIDDIITRLHGSKYFSTLDANMGYYQIKLTEDSSYLTTFNTPFGRFRYVRMPMGAKCSSEIFQREMVNQFGHLEGTEIVVDDILVHGKTLEEHNKRLKAVLDKARAINLKLNKEKCVIAKTEVNYVGHKLTGDGVKPTDARVKAITNMRDPENHNELETILGMLAYVSKFIPNLSELNAPLRDIKNSKEWLWDDKAHKAFQRVKDALSSTPVLRYFDVNKPVRVTVDASMRGLGAALLQENGIVAYASRSLSESEQRYAQIEKEMLGVVFGCERFHKMLYGKQDVTIETDHKTLEKIVLKPIHKAPMRIQRMLLKIQPYEFKLVYCKGKDIGLADCLSRLPLKEVGDNIMDDELMILTIDTLSHLSHRNILNATKIDSELQDVKEMIFRGWPEAKHDVPTSALPYWDYREELSTYNGVVYKGERICIPVKLRPETLKIIHKSHLGMVKCKQRARELVFWPSMNKQIEDMVSRCSACLEHRNKPAREPMVIQPIPSLPWSKVGTDLFELDGNNYLVMVDYYSNFIEVAPLQRDTTTKIVVKRLKENIARYGIMDTLISDNGPQFSSAEFAQFTNAYGINHITSSPGHQQANGLAEKAVQTVKRLIKKCNTTGDDIYIALLDLRNTPRDDIGSPMQRLMGRRGKTLLPITDNLRQPEQQNTKAISARLMDYRQTQKHYYDRGTKERSEILPGDAIRTYSDKSWTPAEFMRSTRYPRSYIIKAGNQAREYRRNKDMIMRTNEKPHTIVAKHNHVPMIPIEPTSQHYNRSLTCSEHSVNNQFKAHDSCPAAVEKPVESREIVEKTYDPPIQSRSGRTIMKPKYLKDFIT